MEYLFWKQGVVGSSPATLDRYFFPVLPFSFDRLHHAKGFFLQMVNIYVHIKVRVLEVIWYC